MLTAGKTEAFFFRAMQHGWAAGSDGSPVPQRPGWHQIKYSDNDYPGYVLVDTWGKDQHDNPVGSKLITHEGLPAWVMKYGRYSYTSEAVPLVRRALMKAYNEKKFYGCRGPYLYEKGALAYINFFDGDFWNFKGEERVFDRSREEDIGGHQYFGMSLLDFGDPDES
jgi:hypothetical protein